MPIRLGIILIIFTLLFVLFVLHRIKLQKLNLNYSLLWLFAAVVMLFCIFSEGLLEKFATLLGIEKVSNMMFLFGFAVLIVITVSLTVIVSVQNKKITTLIQEMGILKKEIGKDKK